MFHVGILLAYELRNVGDLEQLVEFERAATHIVGIYIHHVRSRHVHAAFFEYVLLIRNVDYVNVFDVSGAFDLIYRITAVLLFQNIHGAIQSVMRKRRLADIVLTARNEFRRFCDHRIEIERAVGLICRDLGKLSEQPHSQIADAIARIKSSLCRCVLDRLVGLVFFKPQNLRALAQFTIFRFA